MAGVALLALLGGAGAAGAATGSGTHASAAATTVSRALSPSGSQSGGSVSGIPLYDLGQWVPVHGQLVVAKRGGGYQTLEFQDGTVTKVSKGSLTLNSADGFTRTYPITNSTVVAGQRDGVTSLKTGNHAVVIARVSGGTATAMVIIDRTLLQQSHLPSIGGLTG